MGKKKSGARKRKGSTASTSSTGAGAGGENKDVVTSADAEGEDEIEEVEAVPEPEAASVTDAKPSAKEDVKAPAEDAPVVVKEVQPEAKAAPASGPVLPKGLAENYTLLSDEEKSLATLLVENGQEHLFASWAAPGTDDAKKHAFFAQVKRLHESYPAPGGLVAYISRAKDLLLASKEGKNPLEGWTPSVPLGEVLDPSNARYLELEQIGQPEIAKTAFVLVAGGLGERLGYSGIKVALPTELTTGTTYLQFYLNYFATLQAKYKTPMPLAIMVSDDTHDRTLALLEANQWFGFPKDQLSLLKQEKVASLLDNDARLAILPEDKYQVDCKPHGHGDVHSLLYSTGTARKWMEAGKQWVVFFQDTNGLAFATLAAALGVSKNLDLEVNSLAIPRVAKQAIGAITKLSHRDGRVQIVNVEYNQLDPLLRAEVNPEGDVPDASGFSPYPGNINQLIFRLGPYVSNLEKSHGVMGEFVNPKYADAAKTVFKKPTRLECMMQDYPKILSEKAKVGFASAPAWIAFSPVKNNAADAASAAKGGTPPGSASSGEADQYNVFAEQLRILGAQVEKAAAKDYLGIPVSLGPRVVLSPSFAVTLSELKTRLPTPKDVKISAKSTLVIKGDVVLESLDLDGTLWIEAPEGTQVTVRKVVVKNKGWAFEPVAANDPDEVLRMRGYKLVKGEEAKVVAPAKAGALVLMPDLKLLHPSQVPVEAPKAAPVKAAEAAPVKAAEAAPVKVAEAAPVKAAEAAKPEPTPVAKKVEKKPEPTPKVEPKKAVEPAKSADPAPKPATAPAPQAPAPVVVEEDEDRVQESCMSRALECLLGKRRGHTPQAQHTR